MYLKSITLKNFRKFGTTDNKISFVCAEDYKKDNKINIANKTTLIVGKNNSGKTTVIKALNKLINEGKFTCTDFNFNYLKKLLNSYTEEYLSGDCIDTPILEFVLTINVESSNEDLLTNIIPFMSLADLNKSEISIIVKWEIKDTELFVKSLKKFVLKNYKYQKFDRFLELIEKSNYEISYYNINGEKKREFSIKKLVELTVISANSADSEMCLSTAFNKIIEYRYKNVLDSEVIERIDMQMADINKNLTEDISKQHTENINTSLNKMILEKKCKVLLKADLSFEKLISNIIKYEYIEGENNIPEQQFGLGYTKLMIIIAKIIKYIEKYPETSFNSQINLIAIEEPETYMHPQMQEQFINNINAMITSLLENNNKHVNSQIIITTHSPHILNSKIHEGNTLNNINYITDIHNFAKAICLSDDIIMDLQKNKKRWKQIQNLKFLKKHFKYKVSELFFADAVIFVEGITEYTILKHYIDVNTNFNKYYISVILIDGAHAKVYENLIYALSIPVIIITDIDIKREKKEKGENGEKSKAKKVYKQITNSNIIGRETTNTTLSHFYGSKIVTEIIKKGYKIENNLKIIYQKDSINNFYPTSFEEAFILTNSDNDILNKVLKKIKPDIYDEIINHSGVIVNSYKLQKKLSDSKSEFANELLYEILMCDEEKLIPSLPMYIIDGLNFLIEKLGGN